MMRPVSVHMPRALPVAPVLTNPAGFILSWTDATPVDYLNPASWTLTGPAIGTAEIGYRIERATVATNGTVGTYGIVGTALANATTFTAPSTGASRFNYRVVAFNEAGDSTSTPILVGPAVTVPGVPVIGTATAANASAVARWTAPADAGGSAITGYSVRVVNAANVQVGALRTAAAGATSLTVTGLTTRTAVRFQVRANNAVGSGPYSSLSNAVTR